MDRKEAADAAVGFGLSLSTSALIIIVEAMMAVIPAIHPALAIYSTLAAITPANGSLSCFCLLIAAAAVLTN